MRKRKILRIVSSVVALILCLAVISPLGVLAAEGGMKGGAVTSSGNGWGSPDKGDVGFDGAPSGVRIYITSGKLVEENISKTNAVFKSSDGTWTLDKYKSLALYELSDMGGSSSSVGDIFHGNANLYALFQKSDGSIMRRRAYFFNRDKDKENAGTVFNTKPTFEELTGKSDYYNAWLRNAYTQSTYSVSFSSLSTWANNMFGGKEPKVEIGVFLKNYINQLKAQDSSITYGWLKSIGFPTTKSDFISNKFCIVVEPVMLNYVSGSAKTVYAWSAQDVEHYGKSNLQSTLGDDFEFVELRRDMRTSCYIDYTSNKYGHVTAQYTDDSGHRNPAGGFAFYYSNDVIAQDVPVQVANTVVVDVGAPKYINGETSAESLPPVGSMR